MEVRFTEVLKFLSYVIPKVFLCFVQFIDRHSHSMKGKDIYDNDLKLILVESDLCNGKNSKCDMYRTCTKLMLIISVNT